MFGVAEIAAGIYYLTTIVDAITPAKPAEQVGGGAIGNVSDRVLLQVALRVCETGRGARRRLLEQEGGAELANQLAIAIMNRGVALMKLGRLDAAVEGYAHTSPSPGASPYLPLRRR